MRRLLLVLLLSLAAATAWAMPAPSTPLPVKQPDGTSLMVRAHGDEFGLFFETEDGYTVVRDKTKTWRYAQRGSGGKLKPSAVEAGKGDPARLGLKKHERHDDATMKALDKKRRDAEEARDKTVAKRQQAAAVSASNALGRSSPAPLAGAAATGAAPGSLPPSFQLNAPATFRLAVLLVEFPAEGAEAAVPHTYTPAQIDQLIFSQGTYNTSPLGKAVYGSVRDYYSTVSYGKFTLTGQVFPWVSAAHGKSYYYDPANYDAIAQEAAARSGADLGQFDGYVVLYAGNVDVARIGDVSTSPLWPHMNSYYGSLPYVVSPEKFYSNESYYDDPDLSDIGVLCHELGHVLGLADLYYGGNGGYSVTTWSLMGQGGYGGDVGSGWRPTGLLTLEKERLGWVAPEVLWETTNLSDPWPWLVLPPVAATGAAYKVRSTASWYYLENRQKTGYDLLLPDQGLFIWHVDYTSWVWTDSTRPILALIYSGYHPEWVPPFTTSEAAFPGADRQHTDFETWTLPSCADYDGVCSMHIENISPYYGNGADVGFRLHSEWPAGGVTIDGVSATFPNISVATDAASPGQTVRVPAGTFDGPIVMREGVNLAGAGVGRSILRAPDASTSVLVTGANNATLSGFSLRGFDYLNPNYSPGAGYGTSIGYYMEGSGESSRVSNCSFQGFGEAVSASMETSAAAPLVIANNLITRSSTGIWYGALSNTTFPIVMNNVVFGTDVGIRNGDLTGRSLTTTTYNISYGNATDNYFSDSSVPFPASNLSKDPLIVNAAAEDFHLQAGSPALNGGNPAISDLDGSRSDMGVYGGPLAALNVVTAALPAATTGAAYSQPLVAVSGTAPYAWTVRSGTLPAGLSLSSGGVVSGTPTGSGSSTFTLQVKDAASLTDVRSVSLAVNAAVLTVTTTAVADGYLSTAFSQTLTASGGKTPYTWSITSGTLTTGLSLSSAGVLSGTPTAAGAKTVTVRVKDAAGATASKSLTLTVYALPGVSTASLAGATLNVAYSATLAVSGGKSPYAWSVTGDALPAGLSLSAAGVLSGTPTTAGTSTFTVQVSDANGKAATKTLSLTVSAPAVTQLSAWANLYSAAPNNTSATNLSAGSFTVGSGTNRLLLVAVALETGSAANPTVSASYGGAVLTPIKVTANSQRANVWVGYLPDAQLGSGSKALTVSYSGATGNVSALHVKWAAFSNVNQTAPVASSGGSSAASTSATFGSAVNYVANGMTTVVAANGGTPGTPALSATPSFTASAKTTTNAQTSAGFTTAKHTAAGTYASSTAVKWSGTTSAWSATVAVSLQP